MPRRSGARTSASAPQRSAPPPAAAPAAKPPPPAATQQHAPPPAAAAPAPAPATGGGGMMSGLMGSMASGMAAGVGMSMASRAMDSVMGPRQTEVVHRHEGAAAAPPTNCQLQNDQLTQCMKAGDSSQCQFYLDALKACQQQA
mmetsp:Transcript_79922/g.212110  ORF Transcript_79922/g.212110 Transcript_79922/m.212110 type:complete len:143 (-) Transcript_79922:120-548(-)